MEPDKREYYRGFWSTVQERALFNNVFFLDNYLPLVPTIYAVVSRTGDNFNLYVSALTIIWLMFLCIGCPHYNKSPPVLLICSTGKKNSHLILAIFFTLLAFTEYLVEYFQSIICYQTSTQHTWRNNEGLPFHFCVEALTGKLQINYVFVLQRVNAFYLSLQENRKLLPHQTVIWARKAQKKRCAQNQWNVTCLHMFCWLTADIKAIMLGVKKKCFPLLGNKPLTFM